jgi:hypothetical protein
VPTTANSTEADAAAAQQLPRVPASISGAYLRMWLGVLGLPLDNLIADGISIRNDVIEARYYATRPDGSHYADGKWLAEHTISIPVVW